MQLRFVWLALLFACSSEHSGRVALVTPDECSGKADGVVCNVGGALTCLDGVVAEREDCASKGLSCSVGKGCSVCTPNAVRCDGAKRYRCAADGSSEALVEECAANLQCSVGGCTDSCADAAADRSYLGCDYWPVVTINSQLAPDFKPAVAIGNGNLIPVHVSITQGDVSVAELDVPAGSAQTVELAADPTLKEPKGSLLLRGAAYHLVSSAPVTVHQFNPLKFELPFDCTNPAYEPDQEGGLHDGKCNSYTNDASLLFPSAALAPDTANGASTVEFYAVARQAWMVKPPGAEDWQGLPSFLAINGVGPGKAHVRIESTAFVAASSGADEPVAALDPGGVLEVDLDPGDVLQLVTRAASCTGSDVVVRDLDKVQVCDPGRSYDLTGTHIVANAAVQVIAGHDCSFVPFDRPACDHLEESMTPLSTWGTSAVVSVPSSSAGGQYLLRVLSGADDNTILFDPPAHDPVTLDRGETIEFGAAQALHVRGSKRILAGQYLVGANGGAIGDPSLTLAVPVDQYRQSYNFLSPSTYTQNVVDVIALDTDTVIIDGVLITNFTPVGGTRYRVASVPLTAAGAHEAHGALSSGFGIVLYGLANYASYMLPGGLRLRPILYGI